MSVPDFLEVLLAGGGVAMVLGQRDVGKSTLVKRLGEQAAAAGRKVWHVDADVGQSDVGPPGCIGAHRVGGDEPPRLYFVGSYSPRAHMLECVVGTGRLVEAARHDGADLILVNTTGWIEPGAGAALKRAKIDLVRPDVLVALQREHELDAVLAPYRRTEAPRIIYLPVPPEARERPTEERDARRAADWQAWLAGARGLKLRRATVGLSGAEPRVGLAVGLYDARDECLSSGPLIDVSPGSVEVYAPLAAAARVRRVHVGD